MKVDGTFDLLKNNFHEKVKSIDCDVLLAIEEDSEEVPVQLSLREMAGSFVLHAVLTTLALIVSTVSVYQRQRKAKQEAKNQSIVEEDAEESAPRAPTQETEEEVGLKLIRESQNALSAQQDELEKNLEEVVAQLAFVTSVLRKKHGGTTLYNGNF